MEVLDPQLALLSNWEVLAILKEEAESAKRDVLRTPGTQQKFQDLKTVEYEVISFLSKSPCAEQDRQSVSQLLAKLERFNLTKAEKLQIINLKPQSLIDLHLIVEEIESRLSDEYKEEILRAV
ncbi:calcitonin gene-related peptide-receptor component protein, partial [Cladochytrium replicatum]